MKLFYVKLIDKSVTLIEKPIWFIFNYLNFKIQNIHFFDFPEITGFIKIKNRGSIKMGKGLRITSYRHGNPVGNCSRTTIFCSPNATIEIGDNVSMSNTLIFSQIQISIEDNVMIGGGVQILDSDFHPIDFLSRLVNDRSKIIMKPIKIGNGCFIGANSIILKGVAIGDNSIIGAGSVVTKNIPKHEIWAGNPAKFIKNLL